MDFNLELIIALVVGTLTVGRVARLFVDDDMPFFKWFREWWIDHTGNTWGELITCGFCVGIYIAFANTLWAFVSDLHWTWWFANIWLAGAYVGAIVNARDIPSES